MSVFKSTSRRTGEASSPSFKATGRKSYDYSVVYDWEKENKSSLDILNNYYTRINNGEWLSPEDRASYRTALDSYIDSTNRLRGINKTFGKGYTDEEEKSWNDYVISANKGYDDVNSFYNLFDDSDVYDHWRKGEEYKSLSSNADFAEKSKYVSTYRGGEVYSWVTGMYADNGFEDIQYDYINRDPKAMDRQSYTDTLTNASLLGVDNSERSEMTDDEIAIFNYLYATQGKDVAYEYIDHIESDLNDRRRKTEEEYWAKYAKESPIESSAFSVLESPLKGISYLGQYADYLEDGKIDQNEGYNKFSYINSAIRNEVSQNIEANWGGVGSFAYQTGMSMSDFLYTSAITGGNGNMALAIMGTGAAADTVIASKDMGLSDDQAFWLGTAAGAIEVATEKIGIDALFDIKALKGSAGKYILQNLLAEGAEEGLSNVGNSLVELIDLALSGDDSKIKREIRQIMLEQNVGESDAIGKYVTGKLTELGLDMLGGAISGGVMGGGGATLNYIGNSIQGSKLKRLYGADIGATLTSEALKIDPDNSFAKQMKAKLDKGKNISNAQIVRLVETIDAAYTSQDTAKIKNAIVDRLTELGETGNISKITEVLFKQARGEALTSADYAVLNQSSAGYTVATEMDADNISGGGLANNWAESIGTKKIGDGIYNKRASVKVNTSDGASISISKIADINEGRVSVELEDGTQTDASNITFNDEKTELVFKLATERVGRVEGWTTETANAMIKAYEDASDMTPESFAKGWTEAYDLGKVKGAQSQLSVMPYARNLPEGVRTRAYSIGSALSETKVVKNTNKGSFTFEDSVTPEMQREFTKKQQNDVKALKIISEALGVNVRVFDSPVNAEGKRVGENGSYDAKTRTLRVDLHAGRDGEGLVAFTAAHELTHHMRAYAKDSFNSFADAVFKSLGEGGVNVQELVEKRVDSLRKDGRLKGLNESQAYDLAYEEVVADAAERMLTDSDALAKLSDELKSKDKTLWQKVKDYISSLVKKIKDAYARLNPDSYEGRKLKEVAKDYDEILKIWSEGLVKMSREDATDNSETTSKNLNNVRYSFRNSESGMANDALLPYNEELTKYIEQNGGFIVDSFDKLKEIVNLAFDNPNRKGTAYFGIINTDTLEKIKNSIPNLPQANKDVLFKKGKDYSIATTLDAIRHIVDEKNLTREDVIDYLDRFADTIVEFDSVAFNYYDKGNNKLSGLLFKKRFDDGILVSFDIVSHKKRSVVLQTLYMDSADYQKKKAAETLLMQNAHSNTSKTQVGQPSNSSVSQKSENVNSKISDRIDDSISFHTKYSDRDSNGSKLTKEQVEFFKDSKVRDKNGNLIEVYHGTEKGGFTKFEISDDIGYFFTDRLGVASTYSGTYDEYAPKRFESWDDAIAAAEEIGIDLYLDEDSGKYILDGYSEWDQSELDSIAEELKYYAEERKVNYSVYLNLKNPLIINGNGSNWNAVIDHTGTMVTYDELTDEQLEAIAENEGLDVEELRGYTDDYGNELPVFDIDNNWISYPYSTREWVADARDGGYDGVIFKNISDEGKYGRGYGNESNVYVALESNQIKSTANKNPTDNSDIRYQDRKSAGDSFSNRSLLANALESVAQSPMEKQKLAEYKAKIRELNVQSRKLYEINQEIKELTFGKGKKNPERLKALREEATKTTNRINLYDKKLLDLEATKPLRDVLERETNKAYKAAAQKGREALHRNVEGRHKTEERHKIQRIAKELDALLNRGTKDRNVKKGASPLVRAALDVSDMLFATDDELIVNGVGTEYTTAEAEAMDEYVKLYEEYHSYDNSVSEHKERRAFLRSQMTDLKHSFEGVIERERQRINDTQAATMYDVLIKEYKKLEKAEEGYLKNAYDKDAAAHLEALKEKLGKTVVGDMTLEQLKDLYKAFKMVKTLVSNSNKLFRAEGNETVEKMGSEALGEIEAKGHKEKFNKLVKKAESFLGWENLKPIYLMERTGSKVLQKLFAKVLEGESVWATDMAEARKYAAEQKKAQGYKSWNFEKKVQFTSNTGKTFELNLGQMMSIYAYAKRGEQALEHLRTDGFVYDLTTESKKGMYELNDKTAYKISDEVLLKILGSLSKEQKAYVDAMVKYLSETMGKKGNEVSNVLYGIDLFGEENYFPIRSEGAYLERVREQNEGKSKIKNKGYTKPTTPHARNAIVLSDFGKVWSEHVAEMSSYHAFVLPMEDFYRVYNYQTKSDVDADKRGVIPALENAYSDNATKAIDQLLADLNGGARGDYREALGKSALSLYKAGKVMASMSVVVQQPSSIMRAMAMINPKYFTGSKIGETKRKALWEEMKQYAPVTLIKEMGHFDVGMGRASAEWLMAEEYEGIKEKAKALVLDSDYRNDVLSKPASVADEITWVSIWNAVKRETARENPTMNTSSKEFLKKAGARFEDVIRHTQVYDSTLARSGNMRAKSLYMQMLTAFMAEPTTSINMREMALRSGDKGRIAKTTAAVYGAALLNSVLVALPYAMRDDDEDETFAEKYITALSSSFLDSINPLNSLPFVKDVWSMAQGYSIDRMDASMADDLINSLKKIVMVASDEDREDGAIWGAIGDLVLNLSAFTGVPVQNIWRDIKSLINFGKTISRDIEGMETTWMSIGDAMEEMIRNETPILGWFKGETKGDKLYDALVAGDSKYVARFRATYKDDSTYLSAVRKALRENDPRMREAAEAYINKDYATYNAIRDEIVKEGVFERSLVTDALKAEINYLKEKNEGK